MADEIVPSRIPRGSSSGSRWTFAGAFASARNFVIHSSAATNLLVSGFSWREAALPPSLSLSLFLSFSEWPFPPKQNPRNRRTTPSALCWRGWRARGVFSAIRFQIRGERDEEDKKENRRLTHRCRSRALEAHLPHPRWLWKVLQQIRKEPREIST